MDKQIQELMTLLDCTEEQAMDIIQKDKEIDKMTVRECESDLTQEQKSVAKKYRQGDRKPTVYNFNTAHQKNQDFCKNFMAVTVKNKSFAQKCFHPLDKRRQVRYRFRLHPH